MMFLGFCGHSTATVATKDDFENLSEMASNLGWEKLHCKRTGFHMQPLVSLKLPILKLLPFHVQIQPVAFRNLMSTMGSKQFPTTWFAMPSRKPTTRKTKDLHEKPPFSHWKRWGGCQSFLWPGWEEVATLTALVPACCRSDGSLVVADVDSNEKILAPPGCGAAVVYRLGYYNIILPRTPHSEENLVIYLYLIYRYIIFKK